MITSFVGGEKPSAICFLPAGAMPRQHYIMRGFLSSIQNREVFRVRGVDFRGISCYNDGRKG